MRKTLQVLALALALSASARAGVMQCPITGTPPPPTAPSTAADGDLPCPLSEAALQLLGGILALF